MRSDFIKGSDRLASMPPYIFSELNRMKSEALARGTKLLSLAIGDPDRPTPEPIIDRLRQSVLRPENHGYSPYEGTAAFRQSVADWMGYRFGVSVDPATEVLALIGSKEGLAHLPLALCNPGDSAVYPSPGYPVYQTSLILAGARPIAAPMRPEFGFCPDLDELRTLFSKHRPKMITMCFPSNPTTAVCSRQILQQLVDLAREFDVVIAYDNAYSEIYRDEHNRPCSLLEVEGAKDVAIEFHSFSKSFNMTGWRIAFAVGNPLLLSKLLQVKTNVDSGPLLAVQEAASFALQNSDRLSGEIRRVYEQRFQKLLPGLTRIGIEYYEPQASFFVWARVPTGSSSMEFAKRLIEREGLVVTPGIGFGEHGEGFFRLALTVDLPEIELFLSKLAKYS